LSIESKAISGTAMNSQETSDKKFTCFVVGETSLAIQCAEVLLTKGHKISGVVSPGIRIINWAREKGIPCFTPGPDIIHILSKHTFDYLFSIVNSVVLHDDILSLPNKAAINWHDGPLPRYAGMYATSWAIINQEKEHAVTWHIMEEGVDQGDILKQPPIHINNDDTAFTLNARCYESAINSFTELIDELASGNEKYRKQKLAERTYFGKYQRPPAAGVLNWEETAERLGALVRALDFGPGYVNALGLPKLLIDNEAFIIRSMKILDASSGTTPGKVTHIDNQSLTVATATQDIVLSKLLTIDGHPLSMTDFAARYGLREGHVLPGLKQQISENLTSLNSEICRHEQFWVYRLAKWSPIELPYANNGQARGDTARYSTVPVHIPDEIKAFPAVNNGTVKRRDFVLAAIATYLARISGNYSYTLCFSHDTLRQKIAGLEHFFATHVPWRVELDPTMQFSMVPDKIQAESALVQKHITYIRDIKARYPELKSPIANEEQQLSVVLELLDCLDGYKPLPGSYLTLLLSEDGTECRWVYNTSVLNKDSIATMQRQFISFLKNIAADIDRPISDISVLTEAERRQILIEWNDTKVDYPQDKLIHQIFETQAEKTPDATSVVYEGQSLTYKELNQRANQLAHYLIATGVGPEKMVGIAVERSLEMIVGLYGILKAGGVYMPLDPTYPADRIAYMMQDANVPVLLTQQRLLDKLPPHKARAVCLDSDWDSLIARQSTENPEGKATLENLAYVIYTSGSTGKPKGAMNTHAGILNRLMWMQDAYRLTGDDAVLQKTPFSFDVSVWEFFWPLMFGARLVVARPEGHKDSDYLIKTIIEQKITTMHFVPSMLQIFLMARDVEKCTSLRQVVCSGEALSPELQNKFFAKLNAELHNLYGPTEAAVDVTFWECRKDSGLKTVPIGRPVANTQLYILDRNMQPVPIGVPGELYIGGIQVGRGYLNRPELTIERFIPDPFSKDPKARLYKTGDSCRYLPDGNIEYLGRLDFQVKIRGNRIELGEIEALLGQHPAVREAVVAAREDSPGDIRLAAYLVLNPGTKADAGELRDYVRQKLPDFMVPSYFMFLDNLPLTPNGKTDHKALPAPDREKVESGAKYIAPKNELQKTIADIWQQVLNIQKVGMNDNFFEIGGHSLLLVRVYYRLCDAINKKFSLTDLFKYPTIGTLAAYLAGENGKEEVAVMQESVKRAEARRAAIQQRRQAKQGIK
jgi:amino acid adenylation domain-containing protein